MGGPPLVLWPLYFVLAAFSFYETRVRLSNTLINKGSYSCRNEELGITFTNSSFDFHHWCMHWWSSEWPDWLCVSIMGPLTGKASNSSNPANIFNCGQLSKGHWFTAIHKTTMGLCGCLDGYWGCIGLLFCSAGIGRTGAFCSLSTAIERVKAEGIVDVFHTIKHLRTQRPHMVQNVVSKPCQKPPLSSNEIYLNL